VRTEEKLFVLECCGRCKDESFEGLLKRESIKKRNRDRCRSIKGDVNGFCTQLFVIKLLSGIKEGLKRGAEEGEGRRRETENKEEM
jgi:hypothetical protein